MASVELPQTIPYQPVRVSVHRYHELTRAGAFTEHDGVELLDGVVTEKMSKNTTHRLATRRCDLLPSRIMPPGWHVQNQEPITLQNSEPEPDIRLFKANWPITPIGIQGQGRSNWWLRSPTRRS